MEELLTPEEAAAYLKRSKHTLAHDRLAGRGPRYVKMGDRGAVRYRVADLQEWLEGMVRSSTSEAA